MGVKIPWDGVLTPEVYRNSVTLYYADLGLNTNNLIHFERYLDRSEVIQAWMDEFCEGQTVTHERGIWFYSRNDAMLFKLTWKGRLHER